MKLPILIITLLFIVGLSPVGQCASDPSLSTFPPSLNYPSPIKFYLGGSYSFSRNNYSGFFSGNNMLEKPQKTNKAPLGDGLGMNLGVIIEDIAWLSLEGLYFMQGEKGNTKTAGATVNAYYSTKLSQKLSFLAGGGAGYAYQEVNSIPGNLLLLQGKVGIACEILKNMVVYGAYRVINLPANQSTYSNPGITSSSIDGNLDYSYMPLANISQKETPVLNTFMQRATQDFSNKLGDIKLKFSNYIHGPEVGVLITLG